MLPAADRGLAEVLPENRWIEIDNSIDRALRWLATQQQADGSIQADLTNQPAVTSLSVMAFLARGHKPGAGPYGELLNKAIDYVISTRRENGILSPRGEGTAVTYNHAIAGLMLGEVYGMTDEKRSALVADTIAAALKATWSIQLSPKSTANKGGWRYTSSSGTRPPVSNDADLSVTGWHLMFLRSAKNAEFDVPQESIEQALEYVRRCFFRDRNAFRFRYQSHGGRASKAMAGTGILSLILGGQGDDRMVKTAADTLLSEIPLTGNVTGGSYYYYTVYYCSQAMAQLGGSHWETYYPRIVKELRSTQESSGDWRYPSSRAGASYNTAMAVLALSPPYQMLPIFQK